jgi:hypothetical protein
MISNRQPAKVLWHAVKSMAGFIVWISFLLKANVRLAVSRVERSSFLQRNYLPAVWLGLLRYQLSVLIASC